MDRNMVIKTIAASLALFVVISVIALVCLSYLSSRGIDALPENVWEDLHTMKTRVYDNTLRNVLHNLKHMLSGNLCLESSLSQVPLLNPPEHIS
jgi:DNA-binding SARP family transcriptional activator